MPLPNSDLAIIQNLAGQNVTRVHTDGYIFLNIHFSSEFVMSVTPGATNIFHPADNYWGEVCQARFGTTPRYFKRNKQHDSGAMFELPIEGPVTAVWGIHTAVASYEVLPASDSYDPAGDALRAVMPPDLQNLLCREYREALFHPDFVPVDADSVLADIGIVIDVDGKMVSCTTFENLFSIEQKISTIDDFRDPQFRSRYAVSRIF